MQRRDILAAPRSVSVAVTGASGFRVALRVVQTLHDAGVEIRGVIVTRGALLVAKYEEGLDEEEALREFSVYARVYGEEDFASPLASSSNQPDAMAVVPASMKTVAAIANGYSSNLVSRAALAILRLGRRLVVAPRETPLGVAELRNLLDLAMAGAVIVPLCLGFYHKPRSVEDLVDFAAGKVLDALGVEGHGLYKKWGG